MGRHSARRVVMARDLAQRWLEAQTHPEHRLTIYYVGREARGLPNLFRSFRDAKVKIGSIEPVRDLGVSEAFDAVTVWSRDREAMIQIASWFESHGYETSGVW